MAGAGVRLDDLTSDQLDQLYARAERAEQQLAQVRAYAVAARTAMSGSLCTCPDDCERDCGNRPLAWTLDPAAVLAVLDSGEQPRTDGVPQHAARGTNAEDCPACCADAASGSAPSYPWLCPGPAVERWDTFDAQPGTTDYTRQQALLTQQPGTTAEESTRHDRPVQHCADPTPHPTHPNDLLHHGTRCPGTDHGTTGRTTP